MRCAEESGQYAEHEHERGFVEIVKSEFGESVEAVTALREVAHC